MKEMRFKKIASTFIACFFTFTLVACSSTATFAPVSDLNKVEVISKNTPTPVVKHKNMVPQKSQPTIVNKETASTQFIPINEPLLVKSFSEAQTRNTKTFPKTIESWVWPLKGRIVEAFSKQNNGINIKAMEGQAVFAAADGQVVYCGNGLRGYDNLIILKHNQVFLSAYANNRNIFVKLGDWVRQGQKIAEVGKVNTGQSMLHFEIRRGSEPVNPIVLLGRQ